MDKDGWLTFTKREDDTVKYTFDLTEDLAEIGSSETISSATWTESGPTVSGEGTSNTTFYATVTKSGTAKVVVVTSSSYELVYRLRWISTDTASRTRDYN